MCHECPDSKKTSSAVFFAVIFMLFIIGLIIKATLSAIKEKNNFVGIYMRIFVNHVHLVLITSYYTFNWSDSIYGFFVAIQPFG